MASETIKGTFRHTNLPTSRLSISRNGRALIVYHMMFGKTPQRPLPDVYVLLDVMNGIEPTPEAMTESIAESRHQCNLLYEGR
jgi:hypothetical protein